VDDLDPAERKRRVLDDVVAANTFPEEADDAALLFLLGQPAVLPCVAEVDQGIEVDLIEVFEAGNLAPGEELLAKDALEFREGVFGQFSTYGASARYALTASWMVTRLEGTMAPGDA
jgi:hypothetical protein